MGIKRSRPDLTNLNEAACSSWRFIDREHAIVFRKGDGVVGRAALVDDRNDCVVGLGLPPNQVLATRLCAVVGEQELCWRGRFSDEAGMHSKGHQCVTG